MKILLTFYILDDLLAIFSIRRIVCAFGSFQLDEIGFHCPSSNSILIHSALSLSLSSFSLNSMHIHTLKEENYFSFYLFVSCIYLEYVN